MNLINKIINKKSNRIAIVIKNDSFRIIQEHELNYYEGKHGKGNIELIARERMYSYEIDGATAV